MSGHFVVTTLGPLLWMGGVFAGVTATITFYLLVARIAELNREGDRRVPRFPGNLLFLWPSVVFEWLGIVVARSRGADHLRVDFMLARACRAFFAGSYLLLGAAVALFVVIALSH